MRRGLQGPYHPEDLDGAFAGKPVNALAVEAMLKAGALGYLLKEQAAEHLFEAILQVSSGGTFVHTG